jgi:plasmid stabilization system protein ParE
MPYRVILTEKAETDVDLILKWFSDHRATDAGASWFRQLLIRLDTLEENPERCPLPAESAVIERDLRELLLGRGRYKYRLLFDVVGRTVRVLRVWHGARQSITREEV